MADDAPKLSRKERLFLSNQMRILEALYPEEAQYISTQRVAVERGYEFLYDFELMSHIYEGDDTLSSDEAKEVWDTLEMFGALGDADEKAAPAGAAKGGGPDAGQPAAPDPAPDHPLRHFRGYDGNNESKFMAFAAYTVQKLGRFEYVKLARNNYWNSHMPMRPIYQRMLAVWRELPAENRLDLDAAQAAHVRAAGAPPA